MAPSTAFQATSRPFSSDEVVSPVGAAGAVRSTVVTGWSVEPVLSLPALSLARTS